jgi:hypothetical protein
LVSCHSKATFQLGTLGLQRNHTAAVEIRVHPVDQLVDFDSTVTVDIESGALVHIAAEGDPDAQNELRDGDLPVVIAVARTRDERRRNRR